MEEQIRPGMRLWRETRRQGGDVDQNRGHSLHYRESCEPGRVRTRGAEQLRGGTDEDRVVWMTAKTQSHSNFFVAQIWFVRREVIGEIPFVMARPALNGTFEEPIADPIFRTSAHPANFAQQGRDVNSIAKPPGQRRIAQSFGCFHGETIA
jgi:hypothetical protein